ncbi:suppressor of Mek1 [Pieris rapae]|uniref:suppressor of Mek1 n=1 Tax=Pieris rapae TaxID=64459 RepID=UPI001E27A592|nr:suppressor of Mek1 [Pieris rapae]
MMETLHILTLILCHQVVFHSCRSITDFPDPQNSDAEDLNYEDIRNILRVYPQMIKRKDNSSLSLVGIKKHNSGPIAIILAPSNIAAKYQRKQKIPGLDKHRKNLMKIYADGFTGIAERSEIEQTDGNKEKIANTDVEEDHISLENSVIKHQTVDENVKSPTVKSHNHTHFIVDESTFKNENDDSSRDILGESNSVPDEIVNGVDDKNNFNNGVLDDISTEDNTDIERKEKDISKHLVTPESKDISKHLVTTESPESKHLVNSENDITYFNITDTKSQNLSENNDDEHNLNKSSSKVSLMYNFGEQVNKALKVFYPDIDCIRTDVLNCPYRVINLLFNFHR